MKSNSDREITRSVAIIGTRGYPSYYGGFETAVRKLAPFLVERGWHTVVYGRPGAARMDDPARDKRVEAVETRGLETKSLSTLTFGLTSVLHACIRKPDAAIVMNVANGFWLPLLRLRGIPTVVNVDGIEWERAKWGRLAKMMFKLGARLTAFFGQTLIADSMEIARRWKVDFARESVFIPYGGDVPEDLPLVQGLEHRGYVLIVARFVPENSVEEFFEAVPTIAKNYPVVIVGSSGYGGPLDEKADALSRQLENVHWLGHVSDDAKLLSLWQHCGVYFHGHSVGGTNPALVQAMACGAPTVARDTVYNREVLGERGSFTTIEPRDIVIAVRKLMDDSRLQQEASANGLTRATTTYSWEKVCEAYEREADRATTSRRAAIAPVAR
ncbi:glycosyltransferase [Arthrobacter sp. NQ7]|uniref:glycosyltransferase n=1 Tax=Arthrobacter sp. NQ7 TaxID=3032303 RepID=UPI00240F3A41|nr:glycosyltransferase [Arthrobacter sp. NQ7]MDJ0455838.1 glycosyltransferase [Arthrobacter sp. NQ7]